MKTNLISITVIEPTDGMVLTNAPVGADLTNEEYTFSRQVYLGINDDIANWREIPITDIPLEREVLL